MERFSENGLLSGKEAFLQRRTDWSLELSLIEPWAGREGENGYPVC